MRNKSAGARFQEDVWRASLPASRGSAGASPSRNERPVAPGRALLRILVLFLGFTTLAFADDHASVAPLRDWQFIVIHHSATPNGDAEIFDAAHRARGMINGLAYHFVIDNGTDGKADGLIETGPRWVKQMYGGHCRQAYVNEHGIGICLVGNFSHDEPTQRQLNSLVLLVRGLQEQFKIPDDHILGHGEVIGEFSECPGREFPWKEFKQKLKQAGGTVPLPVGSDAQAQPPARQNFGGGAKPVSSMK